MSFGLPPLAGLEPRLKSSTYIKVCLRFATHKDIRSDGESSYAGKLGSVALVPAKPLGEDGILNQNPIFEMGSSFNFGN